MILTSTMLNEIIVHEAKMVLLEDQIKRDINKLNLLIESGAAQTSKSTKLLVEGIKDQVGTFIS